jgi:uncharacterized FlaG/YvyC family protein
VQAQRTTDVSEFPDRIAPTERAHPVATPHAATKAHAGFSVEVADATPTRSYEVRYGLDPVANVWVASFFDGATGELVKTVPSTKVMHQLAELRAIHERAVDHHA